MKYFIILILIVTLAGCLIGCGISGIGVNAIKKANLAAAQIMKDDTLSIDCKAGMAAGSIVTPTTSAEVRASAMAMQQYAKKDSAEYAQCFTTAVYVSWLIHGGEDVAARVITKLGTLGVIAP